MKTDHLRNGLLLLVVLVMAGMTGVHAQSEKSLSVKRIISTVSPSAEAVPSLMDENKIAYHAIDVVNWKEYPYKPEVRFRIAHTGREILLDYKVKESDIRAVAGEDNGSVWEDACVEFFLSPDRDSCYYNFECNCIGKLLIQAGVVNKSRPMAAPEVLAMVKRWSSLGNRTFDTKSGECNWELTMVIPVTALFIHKIDSLDGKVMNGNFYKCGDKLKVPHFLSWNPIGLAHPMFHCPAFFGTLTFE